MSHTAEMPVPGKFLGDIKGGATAALSAVPIELVYGLFAVAPLGLAFAEHGMRAALWGCILGGVLSFVLRGTGGMLVGTRPATGLILGALATNLLHHPAIASSSHPAELVFVLLLLCTALAGLFQFLFGLIHVGRILKYVPFPVTAGLMLGVAILMLLGSLRPALGSSYDIPWSQVLHAWHPASILVSVTVLAICFHAARRKWSIPGSIVALLAGSLVHHGLAVGLGQEFLGGTSAGITGLVPSLMVWNADVDFLSLVGWLPTLAAYALTIAAFGSLETLLCLSAIGSSQARRPDGNQELRVQGLANLIAGLSGATASVGNLSRVNVNLSAGGRGGLSAIAYAATLGAIVLLAGNTLSLVPQAVTAAIVIYYAIGMVDGGTRRIVEQLVTHRRQIARQYYRVLLANFAVILLVASVAVLGDMMKAVGVGVVAAMFLFVRTGMKPVIRRVTHGDRRRSHKIRTAEDAGRLNRDGAQIAIIEADGPLFFGTADSIAQKIEKVSPQSNFLIIDLKRVSDIDTTGAMSLLQASRKLVGQQKQLLFSGAKPHFENFLNAMGLDSVVAKENWHHDLDHALEAAEDCLLMRLGGPSSHRALGFAETALVAGLTPDEIRTLEGFLIRKDYAAGTLLFSIGDEGDELFVAGGSNVDILVPLKDGKAKRIVGLAPGVIFGEMAMLEGKRRSASAVVMASGTVWGLSRRALDDLLLSHPGIARQVLFNVGCQLASRLRVVTDEMLTLDDD